MIIHNVGYDHRHDADFLIERPAGSGDFLLLLLKTDAIFTLNGASVRLPRHSFFLYPKDMPQYYRCVPQCTFENDWIHFLFEAEEEAQFLQRNIPYAEAIPLKCIEFYSYCIKKIADENASQHAFRADTIRHYFFLMCNELHRERNEGVGSEFDSPYEMMLTVRNKIYSRPYEQRGIDWVSHETRMSRSGFQHLYKKQFGVSFLQDLISSRVSYARMLLTTTDMTISDVATKCGYRNYEHFARQFRASCGMSALAYRRLAKK